jgi:hypothetical protein
MTDRPAPAAEPSWRRDLPTRAEGSAAGRRRTRLFVLLAAWAAALGGLVGVASWFRAHPYPVLLPIVEDPGGARYGLATPQGEQDAAALRAGRWFSRALGPASARGRLEDSLATLSAVRPTEMVVAVLCSPARVGDAGEVLVMPRGRPESLVDWVPLRAVLGRLAAGPSRRVLLLLDVMRPLDDPIAGQLADDVTLRLGKELEGIAGRDKLSVLCAAGAGQVSASSEVWGRSAFLAFAGEGLSGAADLDPVTGNHDGRVTLEELVGYVTPRVDRWSRACRGVGQTPVLLGSAADFLVAPRPRGGPESARALPEPPAYPAWLREGWELRDRWQGEGAGRVAPRTLGRIEAALLEAERAWRGGGDARRIEERWKAALGPLTREFDQSRTLPHPVPRSLALASAFGEKPDDRASEAVAKLLKDRADTLAGPKPAEADAAIAKLSDEFHKATRPATEFALASAVIQSVRPDVQPVPADVVFLDGLLRARQPEPLYVETLLLRRLSARAAASPTVAGWPAEAARLAIEVGLLGERAQSRPRSFAPVRPWLELAARERHLGEVALFSPGFVKLAEAERRLRRASELYSSVLTCEDTIERAWDDRDAAFALLPAALPLIDRDPYLGETWDLAVDATIKLEGALTQTPPPYDTEGDKGTIPALFRAVEPIRHEGDALGRRLQALRDPASAGTVAGLVLRSRADPPEVATWREIDALLSTPFPRAKDREPLWSAGRDLESRLLRAVLATEPDEADRQSSRAPREGRETFVRRARAEAAVRAGRSIRLLRMAGQDEKDLAAPDQLRGRVALGEVDWPGLGRDLRKAWTEDLPARADRLDLSGQERLSRLVPIAADAAFAGLLAREPVARRQGRESDALLGWLSDGMLYEARDLGGVSFHAEAARTYRPTDYAATTPDVRLSVEPASLTLTSRNRSTTARLHVAQSRIATLGKPLLSLPPTSVDGLGVRPGAPLPGGATLSQRGTTSNYDVETGGDSDALTLPIVAELRPGAVRSPESAVSGFLVQYRLGGWAFTARVPVDLTSDSEPFEVLLGEAGSGPTGGLLVRPGTGPTPLSVWVRNPTGSARNVVVELAQGDAGPKVVSPKQRVDAGAMQPVGFAAGPAPPAGKLATLDGPIRLRVLDADREGVVLGSREVRPAILPSTSYVRVTDVRFIPPRDEAGEPNRLSVRVKPIATLAGPPSVVEVVLPPDRIPGFLSAEGGALRGALPAGGKGDLTLFAESIRFEEGAESVGAVDLTIDGVPRAQTFRLRFARQGGPTTAERTSEVAIRLRAPESLKTGDDLAVVAEVDDAPSDSTLDLSLGRERDGRFEARASRRFAGPRRAWIGMSPPGPAGAILVDASLDDWVHAFATAGIRGRYELRAQLRDAEGRLLETASRPVVIEDAPPRWVRLDRPPKQARRGTTLGLRATGDVPASGIKEVVFFLGKPAPDGKPPADAISSPGRLRPGDPPTWTASLALPADKLGPIEIRVRFVSGAGLALSDAATVELLATDPVPTGSIRGRVLEGPRPQPGLTVGLADGKGTKLRDATTDRDGAFAFEDVPVGKYIVTAARPITATQGRAEVEVKEGLPSSVEVELFRVP